jgi:carbonic anhydrase/acetyltransferase-like protein (isoleucine patch superfamily)
MRKMPPLQVAGFALLIILWGAVAVILDLAVLAGLGSPRFDLFLVLWPFAWVSVGLTLLRTTQNLFPLRAGDIPMGSRQELIYHVFHLTFLFFLYYPVAFSRLLPTPLSRPWGRLCGANLGDNTYPGLMSIFDPRFVTIGRSVILGHQSSIIPHVLEGRRVAHFPIRIADHVTIGVNAVVLAGTTIGAGAIVAAGAVVPKFTRIGPGEIWAGLPAKKIGVVAEDSSIPGPIPNLTVTAQVVASEAKQPPVSYSKRTSTTRLTPGVASARNGPRNDGRDEDLRN